MLDVGWSWTVVSWTVDAEFPGMAQLAQQALNSTNSAVAQVGEMETAATILEHVRLQGQDVDWAQCETAAAMSNPPCANYIQHVAMWVRLYSGGPDGPLVTFLDMFAKTFGENLILGSEFFQAITQTRLGSKGALCPFCRAALLCANLVSNKASDGFAKLLT